MCVSRTWKCPECGHAEAISYNWLAEHGGPVCQECDCDMTLQPKAKAADGEDVTVAERLTVKAAASGLKSEDLDEIVHDLAASIAADANNGGLEEQFRYLVAGLGGQHAERQLDELIESQPREGA